MLTGRELIRDTTITHCAGEGDWDLPADNHVGEDDDE